MCAHAVRVAVEEMPGVDSVRVSLNEGYAEIHLAAANTVTVLTVRDAIRRNGFTPKEARIRVAGTLVQRGDAPALVVTNEQFFRLLEHPDAAGRAGELAQLTDGRRVIVDGVVSETPVTPMGPLVLRVMRFN